MTLNSITKQLLILVRKKSKPIIQAQNEIVYLTDLEVNRLLEYPFEESLAISRDIFCFCCITGLRFSEVCSLRKSNIKKDKIVLAVPKSSRALHFPLNPLSIKILENYKGTLNSPFPKVSLQLYNRQIKQCCQIAEIDSQINRITAKDNVFRIESVPKYYAIDSMTSRRSFEMNSIDVG